MGMCVYTCIYMYRCIYLHTYTQTYIYVHIRIYGYIAMTELGNNNVIFIAF